MDTQANNSDKTISPMAKTISPMAKTISPMVAAKSSSLIPSSLPSISEISHNKTYIIIIAVLVLLAVLGINVVLFSENILTYIWRFFKDVLGILGYSVGSGIDIAADATKDTAKTSIDIVGNAVGDVGKLLKKGSDTQKNIAVSDVDKSINSGKKMLGLHDADATPGDSPIQNPISASKNQWCLVGDKDGARDCASVDEADKCMSGQLFPEQAMCLNPTLSQNKPI